MRPVARPAKGKAETDSGVLRALRLGSTVTQVKAKAILQPEFSRRAFMPQRTAPSPPVEPIVPPRAPHFKGGSRPKLVTDWTTIGRGVERGGRAVGSARGSVRRPPLV